LLQTVSQGGRQGSRARLLEVSVRNRGRGVPGKVDSVAELPAAQARVEREVPRRIQGEALEEKRLVERLPIGVRGGLAGESEL
jgi:hypothetical protein